MEISYMDEWLYNVIGVVQLVKIWTHTSPSFVNLKHHLYKWYISRIKREKRTFIQVVNLGKKELLPKLLIF